MTQPADKMGKELSPLKQAFLAVQAAQARVEELESERTEPIAIVGMGCRVPGAGEGTEAYWKLLEERRVAVRECVEQRFASIGHGMPLPEAARWAGLIERIDEFDPQHFGISPREAAGIDPQQRLLLETSWQALEDAGMDPSALYHSAVGVFVGVTSHDYAQMQLQDGGREALNPHFASGIASSVASGRIAYVLGLRGPAVTVDTACSSSLVAVHLACGAIRRGDCAMALAGGVNLILTPEYSLAFAQAGMLSPRGICQTFDERADGFVRGEGCGVVVLKRLRDAEAAGNRILAVIRGSAVNQDGATSGLTVPNGQAQQELLRQAHANAGVEAWQVGYVETHGTGTSLGDPIEAEALGAVFRAGKKREQPLLLGAVKANLGHLEAAAGVIGLIKVVLTLGHGRVPGHPHLDRLNPHVRWKELPLEVVREAQAWPVVDGRRIAGVSSFGFSGTNAHVVIEGVEEKNAVAEGLPEEVLVLSARTAPALRTLAERYAEFLERDKAAWGDVCFTAATGRAALGERLAVAAGSGSQAAARLRQWLRTEEGEKVFRGRVRAGEGSRPAAAMDASADAAAIAKAFVQGHPVDWNAWTARRAYRKVAIPAYPFQRERYWVSLSKWRELAGQATGRPLLGNRLGVAGMRGQFATSLAPDGTLDWIGEHVMDGEVVFPLTGYVELMLEAGMETLGTGTAIEDLVLLSPLVLTGPRTVQVAVESEVQGRSRIRVYAAAGNEAWQCVAEAWLRPAEAAESAAHVDVEELRRKLAAQDVAEFYRTLWVSGAHFGPRFRGLNGLWSGEGEALGEVHARGEEQEYVFAPWRLDACLQLIGAVRGDADLYLPASVGDVRVYGTPATACWSHLRARRLDGRTLVVDVTVAAQDGEVLAEFREMAFRKFVAPAPRPETWFYQTVWQQAAGTPATGPVRRVALVGNTARSRATAAWLRQQGVAVTVAEAGATAAQIASADAVACFAPENEEEAFVEGRVVDRLEAPLRRVLETAQALQRSTAAVKPRLWVVTGGASAVENTGVRLEQTPLTGLARALALEAPELRCALLDTTERQVETAAAEIGSEIIRNGEEPQVAFRAGRRLVARLARLEAPPAPAAGDGTESGAWTLVLGMGIEALEYRVAERREPAPDEVEIAVRATALNFRDVLKATGLLEHAGPIGTDCSGTIARVGGAATGWQVGDAVVAIAPGCFGTYVTTAGALAVRKPEALSYEKAAAQTVAYLTADYCLDELARIRAGERVLIHAAAGGVGLAAVHLSRRAGAIVYATAGSEEKRAYLRHLGVEHVYDSRSLEFRERIEGGVDVVLNSLAGAAVDAGLALLRQSGRFVELGKTDLRPAEDMARQYPGTTYFGADLTPLFAARSPWVAEHMAALLNDVAEGRLPALPLTVFEEAETKQAFRYMAGARHIGRIVIRRGARDFGGTHLVTGGLRGVGLKLAEWLSAEGARGLVLTGRRPPERDAEAVLAQLRVRGTEIRVVTGDIADAETARRVAEACGGELRGVWHCAGVTRDAILAEQDWAGMAEVLRAKAEGAWNVDRATRAAKPEYFVLFSSWASMAGSRGQANYCAANAFLDGLAAARRAEGLPALSVQWGAFGETGMAASENIQRYLARSGMEAMAPKEAFESMARALGAHSAQVAIAPVDWAKYLGQIPAGEQALYSSLRMERTTEGANAGAPETATSGAVASAEVLSALMAAPAGGRKAAVQRLVEQVVRETLDLRASEEIDPDQAFSDLGMDSLLAVELRNKLSGRLERRLPSTLIFDFPTVLKLARFLEQELFPAVEAQGNERSSATGAPKNGVRVAAVEEATAEAAPLDLLAKIEELSDEEVDSIFEKGMRR